MPARPAGAYPLNDVVTDRVEKTQLDQLLEDSRARSESDTSIDDVIAAVAAEPAAAVVTTPEPRPVPAKREDDATVFEAPRPSRAMTGGARSQEALPQKRGLLGDVGYVIRALFKLTEARRELAQINRKLEDERASREQELLGIARQAVGDPEIELPMVERARDQLAAVQEERSVRAGASAAADAEVSALERVRATESQAGLAEVGRLEAELSSLSERLAPLEQSSGEAQAESVRLADALSALDRKISQLRKSLVSVKKGTVDPATTEAEIASVRAEREAVAHDEPAIAAKLDQLGPQISELSEAKDAAQRQILDLRGGEDEAESRHGEELEAIRARKAAQDRAVIHADLDRDKALLCLGEEISLERPEPLVGQLRPIDERDLSIATLERRALDLSELVGGIDRGAVIRGGLMLLLALGSVVALILYLVL